MGLFQRSIFWWRQPHHYLTVSTDPHHWSPYLAAANTFSSFLLMSHLQGVCPLFRHRWSSCKYVEWFFSRLHQQRSARFLQSFLNRYRRSVPNKIIRGTSLGYRLIFCFMSQPFHWKILIELAPMSFNKAIAVSTGTSADGVCELNGPVAILAIRLFPLGNQGIDDRFRLS